MGWGVHYLQECAISASKTFYLPTGERCTRTSELFVEYLIVAGGGGGASGGGGGGGVLTGRQKLAEAGSKQGIEGGGWGMLGPGATSAADTPQT